MYSGSEQLAELYDWRVDLEPEPAPTPTVDPDAPRAAACENIETQLPAGARLASGEDKETRSWLVVVEGEDGEAVTKSFLITDEPDSLVEAMEGIFDGPTVGHGRAFSLGLERKG